MALRCTLFVCVRALPNSFNSKACTFRLPCSVSAAISAPFEQTEQIFSTWAFCGSVRTKDKKLIKPQNRRREFGCSAERAAGGQGTPEAVPDFDIARLEAYTDRFRGELLCVNALLEDEGEDQVIVFKGFSSSLIRATPEDPSESILPPTSVIQSIDRIQAPYNPSQPQYIDQGLSWQEVHQLLEEKGL